MSSSASNPEQQQQQHQDDDGEMSEGGADARSVAAQNLSDLECGADATGSPVGSPSAHSSIDRQNCVPASINTNRSTTARAGCRSAPGSRSSSRTPTRASATQSRPSRSKPSSRSGSRSNSRTRSKGSGTTTPDEINAERERRRVEALAMIREVDSRRNVFDLGPAVPPPHTSSGGASNDGGGLGVAASIRNLFGSSTTKKPQATDSRQTSWGKKKRVGSKSVSDTLAVHDGQWGGWAPHASASAGANATNANQGRAIASSLDEMMMPGMGLDAADACDPSPGMFESIRAFNMAGGNDEDEDYDNNEDGGKRKWKCYNVNEMKRSCSRNGVMITLAVFVIAAVAFVALIGVSSMRASSDGEASHDNDDAGAKPNDLPQQPIPTTPKPPTIADGRLQVFFDVAVSNGITPTMDVFKDPYTPQYRAAKWITTRLPLDMDYHEGNVPDLMQRYGIATFYLSTQPADNTAELHEQDERDDGDDAADDTASILSDDDICEWDGIGCNDVGLVNSIDLPESNLKGTLPYELFSSTQQSLQSITFNDNKLSGTIPDSIVLMDKIVSLDLSGNNIGSTLPPALFGLPSLTDLVLSNNWFEGELVLNNDNVAPLSKLILHNNYLTGTIDGLADLASLEVLDLNSNNLSGSLGSSLFGLSNLSFLRLSNNHLSGTLGSNIGQLTQLSTLSLDRNEHLQGSIPSEIGNLRLLGSLFLHDTGLEGTVPEVVCDLFLDDLTANCGGVNPKVDCDCCSECYEEWQSENS